MAGFDPDSYLAGKPAGGFDPDAYLRGNKAEPKAAPAPTRKPMTLWEIAKQEAKPDIFNTSGASYDLGGKVTDALAPHVPLTDFFKKVGFDSRAAAAAQIENDNITIGAKNFAVEMPFVDKFNAGMGKAFADIGRGAQQLVGMGPNAQQTQETRRLDAPLMKTGGGVSGNIAGNVAAFAPAAAIGPAAGTVGGAGALGATLAGLQPTESPQERLMNMVVGGAMGAGVQAAAGPGAQMLGERAARIEAEAAARQQQNALRDQTLQEARQAGYVFPPSATNPSMINKVLESIGGKDAIRQESAMRNQAVTTRLAQEGLQLPQNQPITETALRNMRNTAAQPYRDVAALNTRAQLALEQLKQARFDANTYHTHAARTGDPNSVAAARNIDAQVNALEQQLEGIATRSGQPELVGALRNARTQIAKSYDVERATNLGTGGVSAPAIGRELDRGRPLTGELATIGRTQQAFPGYMREGEAIPTPGVSKVAALASAMFGGGGAAAMGPAGALAATVPFVAPPAARSLALSPAYQRLMANPNYNVSGSTRELAGLADPASRERLALLARSLGIPSGVTAMEGQ